MKKQTIIKFVIPLVLLTSIYSGIYYNLALWLKNGVFESYWSFFVPNSFFTTSLTITFLVFFVILISSIYYADKITNKQILTICVILIGFCCIYISFATTIEWYYLYFFLMATSIAYLTPCLMKLAKDRVMSERIEGYERNSFLIGAIAWIILSVILFALLGRLYPKASWRILYLITGIINIASSPLINFL